MSTKKVKAENLERGVKVKTPFHEVGDGLPGSGGDEWDEVESIEPQEDGRLKVMMVSGVVLRCSKSSWVDAQP